MVDTPGSLLRSTRESKKFNIAQVVKGTRISAKYIQRMEADDFASLPSPVHARGFLRSYAEFLGLDPNELIASLAPDLQSTSPEIINPISTTDDNKGMELHSQKTSTTNGTNQSEIPIIQPPKDISESIKKNLQPTPTSESEPTLRPNANTNSYHIFSSIGEKLRSQREALGLSLSEVGKHSHVLKRYLESIEAGHFEELPSSVQARGMLMNYARFLEIDTEEILLLFADGLQAQLLEKQKPDNKRFIKTNGSKHRYSFLSRYITIDLLFGAGMIILLIFYAIWGTGKVIDLYNTPASGISAASISDIILTPIHTATVEDPGFIQTAILETSTPGLDATQISNIPANVQGQVQIYIVVLQRTWLRVIVDNKISLEGRVETGNAYSFNGDNQIEVLTGNGAALQIIYNQTDLGVMGEFGQVIDNIYTPNSIIKPTATITPTPTITPIPSLTPRTTSTSIP